MHQRFRYWKKRVQLAWRTLRQRIRPVPEQAMLHVDSPRPTDGKLNIRGWAAAEGGIQQVDIRIADKLFVPVQTGLRRLDVAKRYPELSGAENSGFSAIVDVSNLAKGNHTVRVYATSRRGRFIGHRMSVPIGTGYWQREWSAERLAEALDRMENKPLISVLMPVYRTPERWLRRAIESVLTQLYPHWELCIADDCSLSPQVRHILEEYRQKDPRIKVAYRESNGHIAEASNTALGLASGEFVALLDHDDEITSDALLEIALAYQTDPLADMFYSDEDKIDEDDYCSDPFFKPDWSPEYFLTCMYTCHLGVYRTDLARRLGGFRPQVTGAQDYDLALRFVAHSQRIVHIPKVLYHWRMHADSTALAGENKDYAYPAAQQALRDHLLSLPIGGEVLPGPSYGFHCIRFDIQSEPLVSIVIPTAARIVEYEGESIDLLRECVQSVLASSTWRRLEIIVVDNGDLRPELKGWLDPRVRLVTYQDHHFNLARKINFGVQHATGEHVVLLNDDVKVITPDWIEQMLQYSQQPNVGAVGAKLLFPTGRIQHAGVLLLNGNPGHPYYDHPKEELGYFLSAAVARNYLAVTGACLMTKRVLFEEVGGFSEEFWLNYNDVDFCLKLHQRGYRTVYVPNAMLYHYESISRANPGRVAPEELKRFKDKWYKLYAEDPYYNPNLPSDQPYYSVL